MSSTMLIGSGDVGALLMGKNTDGHQKLLQKFVSGEKPYFNAKASPIDALRTGAILEERFALVLDDSYYPQCFYQSKIMDVFGCTIDFGKIDAGKLVDFMELKTCNFNDFLLFEPHRNNQNSGIEFIKKYYKKNYNQVMEQLFVTELESSEITFLAVYSYNDDENYVRDIKQNEYMTFRLYRDEKVISEIKNRGEIFQKIKDYYEKD